MNETMHEKLTQAIATMTQTPTNENLFAVLQQLGDMLEAGAGVLVPADRMPDEPDQEEDRIQYRMLQGSDGTPLLVCFTAQAELERGAATTAVELPLEQLLGTALSNEQVGGVVINPCLLYTSHLLRGYEQLDWSLRQLGGQVRLQDKTSQGDAWNETT